MEEAEADCAVAFAEAQRWVEVSAFNSSPFHVSLRPRGGRREVRAARPLRALASSRDSRGRAAGGFACAVLGT